MESRAASPEQRTTMFKTAASLSTLIIAALFVQLCWASAAHASSCTESYDHRTQYSTPSSLDVDILGKHSELTVYIHDYRAVAEIDGCFYTITDAPLELDTADQLTLHFVFIDSLTTKLLLHTQDGMTFTLQPGGGYFEYTLTYGIEASLSFPGSPHDAPIVPIVVRKPKEPEQEPS